MAFVSSLTPSSFTGNRVPTKAVTANHSVVVMAFDPYEQMRNPPMPKVIPSVPTSKPSKPSKVWRDFLASELKLSTTQYLPEPVSDAIPGYAEFMSKLALRARPRLPSPGVAGPTVSDAYMARCVTAQLKAASVPGGVYTPRCAEGAIRGQAETARVAALARSFRTTQRPAGELTASMYETRRRAMISSHGCSYEEDLLNKLPATSAALVLGRDEALASCARYAIPTGAVETYMTNCIERNVRRTAAPFGEYSVMCAEGTIRGMAEEKRVVGLSAKFRIGTLSPLAQEQWKFDAKKNARDNYSHLCTYEEGLFNKYPSVAASMRTPFGSYP